MVVWECCSFAGPQLTRIWHSSHGNEMSISQQLSHWWVNDSVPLDVWSQVIDFFVVTQQDGATQKIPVLTLDYLRHFREEQDVGQLPFAHITPKFRSSLMNAGSPTLPKSVGAPPLLCSRSRRTSDVCQLVDDLAELTPPKGRQSDEELLQ